MRDGDLKEVLFDEIRLEVRQRLKDGRRKGETEFEAMSEMLWKEREKRTALRSALEAILRVASAALDGERDSLNKSADVLEWRKP